MLIDINTVSSIVIWFIIGVATSLVIFLTIAGFIAIVDCIISMAREVFSKRKSVSFGIRILEHNGQQYLVTEKGCICPVIKEVSNIKSMSAKDLLKHSLMSDNRQPKK